MGEAAAWPGLDGAVVINLDRRPDRMDRFHAAWGATVPLDRLHRLPASDGRALVGFGASPWFRFRGKDVIWAGRAGCALSHARALRLAREKGWMSVLILEDDARPSDAFDLALIDRALNRTDWDILYLGCSDARALDGQGPDPQGLVRVAGALDAHAYVVREPAIAWAADRLPDETRLWSWIAANKAVDRWFRRRLGRRFRILAFETLQATQADDASDIMHRPAGYGDRRRLTLDRASHLGQRLTDLVDGWVMPLAALYRRVAGF